MFLPFLFRWTVEQWSTYKIKLGLVIFGFATACVLLIASLYIDRSLIRANPAWIDPNLNLATILREQPNDSIGGVSRASIKALAQTSAVDTATWFSIKELRINLDDGGQATLNVLFFDQLLIDKIIEPRLRHTFQGRGSGVWLAEPDAFRTSVGNNLSLVNRDQIVPINGVLPVKLTQIGRVKVDAWISADFLSTQSPFANGPMRSKFLNHAEMYTGLVEVPKNTTIDELASIFQNIDVSDSSMTFSGVVGVSKLLEGVQLDPIAAKHSKRFYGLITLLLVFLTLISAYGCYTLFLSQSLAERESRRVLRILGADGIRESFSHLLILSLSSVVLFVLVALISNPLCEYFFVLASTSPPGEVPPLSLFDQITSVLLMVSVFALTASAGRASIGRINLFTREQGESLSRKAHYIMSLLLTAQLTLSICSLVILLNVIFNTIMTGYSYKLSDDIAYFELDTRGQFLDLDAITELGASSHLDGPVGLKMGDLDSYQPVRLEDDELLSELTFDVQYINAGFLELFGFPFANANYELVVSEAAKQLLSQGGKNEVVGNSVNVSPLNGAKPIGLVIPDLALRGKFAAPQPTIYYPLREITRFRTPSKLLVLFRDSERNDQALRQAISSQNANLQIGETKLLSDSLRQRDTQQLALLLIVFVVTIFMICLSFLNFRSQLVNQLELIARELKIRITLGISFLQLLLFLAKGYLLIVGASLIFSTLLMYFFEGSLTAMGLLGGVSSLAYQMVAGVILIIILALETARVLRRFTKGSLRIF